MTDAAPVCAAVGVTDLAAEKLRDARAQAVEARRTARRTLTSVTASVSPQAV